MCGIHLVINGALGYHSKIEDFFKDAFLANQVRGMHATGMFTVAHHTDRRIDHVKKAVPASDFVVSALGRTAVTAAGRSLVAVGHVRHATMGASGADANAHPFLVTRADGSRVIGVHNGTLQGWRNKEGANGVDVDSAWAFKTIAREGAVDAFEYFNGAFCMVWFDSKEPDTLFIARNDQRPFHFMMTEDGKHILGASEAGMLGWVAERNGFKLGTGPLNNIFSLDPGRVYKFDLKNVGGYSSYEFPKYNPETSVVPPVTQTALVPASHSSYRQAYGLQRSDDWVYEDGIYSYRGNRPGSTDMWGSQKRVLERAKKALAEARNTTLAKALQSATEAEAAIAEQASFDDGTLSFDQLLDQELDKEEQTQTNFRSIDAWALVGEKITIPKPNDRNATQEEIKSARKAEQYGQVVAFIGVLYDDDTGEMYGEYYCWEGTKQVQYDAVIRGLSKSYAKLRYENSNEAVPLSVVGRVADGAGIGGGPVMVLSELEDGAKQMIAAKLAKLTAKAN